MSRIVKGLFGGKSKSEEILRQFKPVGFSSPGGSATFNPGTNSFTFTRSPERDVAVGDVVQALRDKGASLSEFRAGLRSGFQGLTDLRSRTLEENLAGFEGLTKGIDESVRARINALRNTGRQTIGNIRSELSRRRLQGSSFLRSQVTGAEAEFAQLEDEVRAAGQRERAEVEQFVATATAELRDAFADDESLQFLTETGLNLELVTQQMDTEIAAAQTVLQDLNLDTALTATVASQASALIADNLKAQAEARAAQEQSAEDFAGTIIGAYLAAKSGGGVSDARFKRDVRRVGMSDEGIGIFAFRYLWDDVVRIGVIAQDVMRLRPDAVSEKNGSLRVDYDSLGIRPGVMYG